MNLRPSEKKKTSSVEPLIQSVARQAGSIPFSTYVASQTTSFCLEHASGQARTTLQKMIVSHRASSPNLLVSPSKMCIPMALGDLNTFACLVDPIFSRVSVTPN